MGGRDRLSWSVQRPGMIRPRVRTGGTCPARSISSVLNEPVRIEANLKVKEVFFEDEAFTTSRERVLQSCGSCQEQTLSIVWSCNTLDLEMMQAMKKANFHLLIVGSESGEQR